MKTTLVMCALACATVVGCFRAGEEPSPAQLCIDLADWSPPATCPSGQQAQAYMRARFRWIPPDTDITTAAATTPSPYGGQCCY